MAILRRCRNCGALYEGQRCPHCTRKFARKRQQDNESTKLYGSWRWRQCRKNAILHYMGYDIWLMGIGKVVRLDRPVVHHILEREERPDLVYRLDNLITCSMDSHAEIHEMYRKDKPTALRRIAAGIKKFEELFNDDRKD